MSTMDKWVVVVPAGTLHHFVSLHLEAYTFIEDKFAVEPLPRMEQRFMPGKDKRKWKPPQWKRA